MSAIRTWLLGVFAAAAALSILYSLLPKGKFTVIARYTGGLVLLLVLLRPLLGLDTEDLRRRYDQWTEEVRATNETAQQENTDALASLIADKTGAYIQKKAAGLGLDCHAEVTCEVRDGTPFPASVWLDIPRSAALETVIAEDLDIAKDHQFWREAYQ